MWTNIGSNADAVANEITLQECKFCGIRPHVVLVGVVSEIKPIGDQLDVAEHSAR